MKASLRFPDHGVRRAAALVAVLAALAACTASSGDSPQTSLAPAHAAQSPATTRSPVALPTGAGVFSSAPPLKTIRASHTATLLPDGRILVLGGYRGDGANWTAELRDPATGVFTSTGNLGDARYFHTATLLPDGRVLVVGGSADNQVTLASAELWDPATGAFTRAGTLATTRMFHTATLLDDGWVLVVGGLSSAGGTRAPDAELWDPATGKFGPAGNLAQPRGWHTATLLPDGRVLVATGPKQVEVWDPDTRSFSPAGSLGQESWWGTATPLSDGRVLVVGGLAGDGYPGDGGAVASAELWDPAASDFEPAGTLGQARGMHSATLLPDGRVLVVGGAPAGGGPTALASTEIWDPATRTFAPGAPLAGVRAGHTATLLPDGRVVVIGGDEAGHGLATVEVWQGPSGG